MKKVFLMSWIAAIAISLLLFSAGTVMAPPATTCVTTATQICVGNIPAGGVTGGTNHGFCEEGSEDQWHFVITQLDPATEAGAPAYITAVFQTAGSVQINLDPPITGGVAHYRTEGVYLTDTLLSACGILPAGSCYGNFNLSHAPCATTTTTTTTDTTITTQTTPSTEVGGEIYSVNQTLLMVPAIALGVAILSVIGIIVRRRIIH